jgi:hypothetical protein
METDKLLAAVEDYQQTLQDSGSIDCTTDPASFKAALEAARAARGVVSERASEVRAHRNDTVIPTLVSVKQALATAQEEQATEETQQ